jgi:proteasome lid subunit RPN8/RPN11
MVAQAIAELPNECCGLLAGPAGGDVCRHYPLANAAASPREYLSDPESLFAAHKDMRRHRLEIQAIYHSHPSSDPIPSRTDCERLQYPEAVHLIISLKASEPIIRAWWLSPDSFREAEWDIT